MKNRPLNVFILNDEAQVAGKLRKYLKHRFGDKLRVSLFFNSRSCLRMLDNHVDLVVVDDYLEGDVHTGLPAVEVTKQIKAEHPATEVIVLSSHEDVGLKLEAMRSGAREYILNKKGAWHRIRTILDQSVQQPIRYFVAEYGVRVFIVVFVGWWILLGVAAWLALRFWNNDLV